MKAVEWAGQARLDTRRIDPKKYAEPRLGGLHTKENGDVLESRLVWEKAPAKAPSHITIVSYHTDRIRRPRPTLLAHREAHTVACG